MEIIDISGYVAEEKLAIAQKYLIPQVRKCSCLLRKETCPLTKVPTCLLRKSTCPLRKDSCTLRKDNCTLRKDTCSSWEGTCLMTMRMGTFPLTNGTCPLRKGTCLLCKSTYPYRYLFREGTCPPSKSTCPLWKGNGPPLRQWSVLDHISMLNFTRFKTSPGWTVARSTSPMRGSTRSSSHTAGNVIFVGDIIQWVRYIPIYVVLNVRYQIGTGHNLIPRLQKN